MQRFPGRAILRRFVGEHLTGIAYEPFRNVLLDILASRNHEPEGMKDVIDAILAA